MAAKQVIHMTPDEIHRLQGAVGGILDRGPWDAEKRALAVMVARTLHAILDGLPYNASLPVVVDSPTED